jgi:hypothetical protein
MDRGSDLIGIIPKLVRFTSAGYEQTFKSLLTSTITRRFNAGVEKKRLSASLLVSHAHVNPATKGSNCGISRCIVVLLALGHENKSYNLTTYHDHPMCLSCFQWLKDCIPSTKPESEVVSPLVTPTPPQVKQRPQIPAVPESLPSQVDETLAECPR